ncbi:MAG: acyl-CoA synthetase [Alphaproteobacteria bacterium]|nr:MAG: acyl-CoA synthetase [Alphaproteobacteria bacterium]
MAVFFDDIGFHARVRPAKKAICDLSTKRSWTYLETDEVVSRTVTVLKASGVVAGERVVVLAKNCAEFIFIHFACARIGAMFVPLNWRLAKPELEYLIKNADPALVVGDECLVENNLDGITLASWRDQVEAAPLFKTVRPDADKPSLILYTSGTTGRPKGVLLSENNIATTTENFVVLGHVSNSSVFLCDSPMFHVIGLIVNVRPALHMGGEVLISNGFKAQQTLTRIAKPDLAISHYFCVPQMALAIRKLPEYKPEQLSGLTGIFTGGGPHSPAHINAWLNDGIMAIDGYGMSEAGTISGMPLDGDLVRRHAGAVGITPPGVEISISDLNGNEVGQGEAGEVHVKGANVFSGYWRNADAVADAFTKSGWFKTGDIGRIDSDGFLWLLGRSKDMYISGGENVYPAEIEGALAGNPSIAECAVVQQSDEQWGEVGHLFVVPSLDSCLTSENIVSELNTCLARYKIPKHVSFIDKLPRNSAGKVRKIILRELLEGAKND